MIDELCVESDDWASYSHTWPWGQEMNELTRSVIVLFHELLWTNVTSTLCYSYKINSWEHESTLLICETGLSHLLNLNMNQWFTLGLKPPRCTQVVKVPLASFLRKRCVQFDPLFTRCLTWRARCRGANFTGLAIFSFGWNEFGEVIKKNPYTTSGGVACTRVQFFTTLHKSRESLTTSNWGQYDWDKQWGTKVTSPSSGMRNVRYITSRMQWRMPLTVVYCYHSYLWEKMSR